MQPVFECTYRVNYKFSSPDRKLSFYIRITITLKAKVFTTINILFIYNKADEMNLVSFVLIMYLIWSTIWSTNAFYPNNSFS